MQRHRSAVAAAAVAVLWGGVSAWLAIRFSGRIRDWSVMTDELQYAKLATSIADTYSPLPAIHGTSISVVNQLYPLLIAPLHGGLAPPTAFRATHVLNAVVMASAVVPVYLLGRQILSRPWSFAVALVSVLLPWMVLTGFVMTEAVAYPSFLWALLGLQRTIAAPSRRGDVLAVGALTLAILARAQFAVLVVVLPLAILAHEIGQASSPPGSKGLWRRLLVGTRRAVQQHRLLAALYALGAAGTAVVAAVGSVSSLLGSYSVTAERGSPLPSGVWLAAARHIDTVAIGCGLVPLVLGGAWMGAAIVRARSGREHALATLSLLTAVLLTVETASYDLRFGGSDIVRDRYLFYLVPLLLVGSAAALAHTPRRHVAIGAALVTILFAATSPELGFPTSPGLSVDSPASVLNDSLIEQAGGLGTGTFVALMGLLVGIVLVLGVLLAPRRPLALILFAALLTFSTATLRTGMDRTLTSTGLSGRPLAGPPGLVLDWLDAVLPDDATAALVPFPLSTAWDTSAIQWWDVEFWNRSVTRTYVADDENFTYTPFPRRTLAIDWPSGAISGTDDAPLYVVAAPGDSRFQLAGRQHAANAGLVVIAVERPYRAVWASRGLYTDGWARPGRQATIRIYGRRAKRAELVTVRISLAAPDSTAARYRISTPAAARAGLLLAGEMGEVSGSVCVPAGSAADLSIATRSGAHIQGAPLSPDVRTTRLVGVHVDAIAVVLTGQPCRPT